MTDKSWMIYGAYGYSGVLVSEEAVRRGHNPVLAGRSADKLVPLATRLGLDHLVVDLQDEDTLAKTVADFDLVFHAAGPFIATSHPMVRACLKGGTNYVDITGELSVLEQTLSYDQQAQQQGIVLISGIGFGVIPTDCMAKYVADRVSNATDLTLAVATTSSPSAGTLKTILEQIPTGTLVRRNGQLVRHAPREGARRIRFVDREHTVLPTTWGDLVTAYRTTGIPNITTYMAFPKRFAPLMPWAGLLGMAKYVADRVSNATDLTLAVATTSSPSAGTLKTILEQIPTGTLVRRNGQLVRHAPREGARRIRFVDREHTVLPTTWGDLVTAYRTTGIPNITTYMAFPKRFAPLMPWAGPLSQNLLAIGAVRRLLQKWVEKTVRGPDEHTRQTAHSYVWARAANEKGDEAQAWLETVEAYYFTAVAGVRSVEKIFAERPRGGLTPALAFGADFVLELHGTKRYDRLTDL